jgi:S1-C subfamily serine protease
MISSGFPLVVLALALMFPTACRAPQVKPDSAPPLASPAEATAAPASPVPPPPAPSQMTCEEYERNNIQVFETMAPATVFVTQKQLVQDWWSWRSAEVEAGTGSGLVWDLKGHIVTNFHVVANGTSFRVTLYGGADHEAEFVGGDPNKDVAVLKIDPSRLKAPLTPVLLPAPDSPPLRVGQTTIAIGNPFGLDHTLTVGVVSALGREVKGYGGVTIRDMIQTDASINPGNSGGPLLDRQGRLIGMNTMIYTKVGQSAGIGFAVPARTLVRIVPQIIAHGKPRQVGFGIDIVPDSLARRSGIRGVVIAAVLPGSPAARAGLRGLRRSVRATVVGDVIVAIDGKPVDDYDDLYNALDGREPGQSAVVTIEREGKRIRVDVGLVAVE